MRARYGTSQDGCTEGARPGAPVGNMDYFYPNMDSK